MRKLLFFLFLFIVYYVGAMYENAGLLVLFLAQFFLMLLMFALSRYLKKHVSISVNERTIYAEQERPFTVRFRIDSTGRIPVGRVGLFFQCRCKNNGIRFSRKQRFENLSAAGEILSFQETYSHCGIYTIQLKRLAVFDPMALFSGKRKLQDEIRVIIFPEKYEMKLELSTDQAKEEGNIESRLRGELEDIRQIREYREGDLPRYIHWNQTARTDTVWVKEFESRKAEQISLYLDFCGRGAFWVPDLDAFCILLNALLCGLIKKAVSVKVYWKDPVGPGRACMELGGEWQCMDLFLSLYGYLQEIYRKEHGNRRRNDRSEVRTIDLPYALRLTPDLGLYQGERLIFQFSGEKLQEELSQRDFVV